MPIAYSFYLHFAGTSSEESQDAMKTTATNTMNINLLPEQARQELFDFYRFCSPVIMPSRKREGSVFKTS
jgi:hypothetical protein